MLNNIIVDKLRLYIPAEIIPQRKNAEGYLDSKKGIQWFKKKLEDNLNNHLPERAFRTYMRYGKLFIEFNPTRYNKQPGKIPDDVNLQMIPEKIFLKMFKLMDKITEGISEHAVISELNLTKNVLLKEKLSNYMNMLLNLKTARGVHPISFNSKDSKSVYFSTLKTNYKEKDYTGTRLIKFYDKTAEMKYVKGKNVKNIVLREELTDSEKEQLGPRYLKEKNAVNLEGANLLRIELTYKQSTNLSKLAKYDGDADAANLSLNLLMDKLKKNALYEFFDDFFEVELKKFLFYNDINNPINQEVKRNKFNMILPTLSLGENLGLESEIYYLMHLLCKAGMNTGTVNKKLKLINSGIVNNKYYVELYKALFQNESIIPAKINLNLYEHLQKFDKKNTETGNTIVSDEMYDWDEEDDDVYDYDEDFGEDFGEDYDLLEDDE